MLSQPPQLVRRPAARGIGRGDIFRPRDPAREETLARVMTSAIVHHPSLIPVAAQLFVQRCC